MKSLHQENQIAEYGSTEYESNKSDWKSLRKGKSLKSGRDVELYYRTEGYKPAGSCAIWIRERYGVTIYFGDGTTGGKFYSGENAKENAIKYFTELTGIEIL